MNREQISTLNELRSSGLTSHSAPQGPILGKLILLIYINDLLEGLKKKIQLFFGNNYVFSTANDPDHSSEEFDEKSC